MKKLLVLILSVVACFGEKLAQEGKRIPDYPRATSVAAPTQSFLNYWDAAGTANNVKSISVSDFLKNITSSSGGSSVALNGSLITNANFVSFLQSVSGSNLVLNPSIVMTNNSTVRNLYNYGTGTTITTDALLEEACWAPSATGASFTVATNLPTGSGTVVVWNMDVVAASAGNTITNSQTMNHLGNWGVLKAGTNHFHFVYLGGIITTWQDEAQIAAVQIADASVDDAHFQRLGRLDQDTATTSSPIFATPNAGDNDGSAATTAFVQKELTNSLASGESVFYATKYGASTGATDSGVAINSAIADAQNAGGGTVVIPAGVFNITNTIQISKTVHIIGASQGGYVFNRSPFTTGTVLKWTGASGGTLFLVEPSSTTAPVIAPIVENLALDGNITNAAYGLKIEACVSGIFRNIAARSASVAAVWTGNYSNTNYTGLNFTYECMFDGLWLDQTVDNTSHGGSGDCLVMSGPQTGSSGTENDTTFCTFRNLWCYHENGRGVVFVEADNCQFINVNVGRHGSGTGIGIELLATAAGTSVSNNEFFGVYYGAGGITSRNGTLPAQANFIYGLSTSGGQGSITIEAGSTLYFIKGDSTASLGNMATKNLTTAGNLVLSAPSGAGLDFVGQTSSGTQIRLQNNTVGMSGRNAANSADIELFRINTGGEFDIKGPTRFENTITVGDTQNFLFSGTTGTKFGTATTQKIGFFNATPIVQPASTTDLRAALISLGFLATGGATPLDLNGGALSAAAGSFTGTITSTASGLYGVDFNTATTSSGEIRLANNAVGIVGRNAAGNADVELFRINSSDVFNIRSAARFENDVTIADTHNLLFSTGTGTKFGTTTSQKIGFWNANPIVQPANTTDLRTALINEGLLASGGATPLNLNGGDLTANSVTLTQGTANTSVVTVNGFSLTGSSAVTGIDLSGTWNTSGNPTFLKVNVTNTASGASSLIEDVQVNGTSVFKIDKNGGVTQTAQASGAATFFQGRTLGGSLRARLADFTGTSAYLSLDQDTAIIQAGTTTDTYLSRDSAAVWQLGLDAASPVAQKLKAHDATGTDHDGASLTVAGGQSTGTGRGGALIGKTVPSSTTGSSANAESERYHFPAKAVTLVNNTPTTVATIACASGKFVASEFFVTVHADDGSVFQDRSLRFGVTAHNISGTVTTGVDTPNESPIISSGTMTAAITAIANGNAVDIKVTAASSITPTTFTATVSIPSINGNSTAAVTEI